MGQHAKGWVLNPASPAKAGARRGWNGFYKVNFRHDGHRYQISTGQRDFGLAAEAAKQIYAKVIAGALRPRRFIRAPGAAGVPFLATAAEWLEDVRSALDVTTWKQYRMYVDTHFDPVFATLEDITQASAANYWRRRLSEVKRKTVLKELSALRGFLAWAVEKGYLEAAPVVSSPPEKAHGTPDTKRPHKAAPNVLPARQVEAILAELPKFSRGVPGPTPTAPTRGAGNVRRERSFPVQALFVVSWETALRPETLACLRAPHDYARGRKTLIIRDEADKVRFGRELPLSARARKALDSVCPEIGLIFGRHDYREPLEAAALAAGLPQKLVDSLSPYDFRHSRLTALAQESNDLPGIAYLAGHKQVTTTAKYIHPNRQAAERVLEATRKAGRR